MHGSECMLECFPFALFYYVHNDSKNKLSEEWDRIKCFPYYYSVGKKKKELNNCIFKILKFNHHLLASKAAFIKAITSS